MTIDLQLPKTITMTELIKRLQQITTDNTEVDWQDFLAWLELFCQQQGWDVEYHLPTDYSCAIFADDNCMLRL